MKREQLVELGIDEEIAKKVLDINGSDIENAKQPLTERAEAAEGERDSLQAQLDAANEAMKGFEGIDPADLRQKLTEAQQAQQELISQHAAELAARDSRTETERFLAEKKFINDITRAHFIDQTEAALADPVNKGKNRQDIFDALTKGEDGKIKSGIFLEENPNQVLNLPPSGNTELPNDDAFQKHLNKYQKG